MCARSVRWLLRRRFLNRGIYIRKTVRVWLVSVDQAVVTSDKGTVVVATSKPPGMLACSTLSMALSRRLNGTLPMPLPISWIAEERRTALGSEMLGALAAPIWIQRIGTPSAPAFAAAISNRSILGPHR